MRSLWVILLDASASMGEPFRGAPGAREVSHGVVSTILAAAKRALLSRIKSLPVGTHVSLATFADDVHSIFQTTHAPSHELDAVIKPIAAGGATHLDAAIELARGQVVRSRGAFRHASILLITDGLSHPAHRAAPTAASQDKGISMSTILINPTPQGQEIAERISAGGKVYPAESAEALDRALAAAAKEHIRAARRARLPALAAISSALAGLSLALAGALARLGDVPILGLTVLGGAALLFAGLAVPLLCFAREEVLGASPNGSQRTVQRVFRRGTAVRALAILVSVTSVATSLGGFYLAGDFASAAMIEQPPDGVIDDFSLAGPLPANCVSQGSENVERPLQFYCLYSQNAEARLSQTRQRNDYCLTVAYSIPASPSGESNRLTLRRESGALLDLSEYDGVQLRLRVRRPTAAVLRITLADIASPGDLGVAKGEELWSCDLDDVLGASVDEFQTVTCWFHDFRLAGARANDCKLTPSQISAYEFTLVSHQENAVTGEVQLASFCGIRN